LFLLLLLAVEKITNVSVDFFALSFLGVRQMLHLDSEVAYRDDRSGHVAEEFAQNG
jgi:hypothetical protein